MAPTRELAKQVEREFQQAAPGLKTGCYYGGTILSCPVLCRTAPTARCPAAGGKLTCLKGLNKLGPDTVLKNCAECRLRHWGPDQRPASGH